MLYLSKFLERPRSNQVAYSHYTNVETLFDRVSEFQQIGTTVDSKVHRQM